MKKTFLIGIVPLTLNATLPDRVLDDRGTYRNRWGIMASVGSKVFGFTFTGMSLKVKDAEKLDMKTVLYSLLGDATCYLSNPNVDDFKKEFGYTESGTIEEFRQGENVFKACRDAFMFLSSVGITEAQIYEEMLRIDG